MRGAPEFDAGVRRESRSHDRLALSALRRWLFAAAVALLAIPSPLAADDYAWDLPRGFPKPVVPADNPMSVAKVELGRRLFHEPRLSVTGTHACATCHEPRRAFTDGRAQALGATGALHPRSAMSLANAAYQAGFGWVDPRLDTLEKQVLQPLLNEHPVEMGMSGRERETLRVLRDDPRYSREFARAFPHDDDPVTLENLARAIAAFERTLVSGRSAFDRRVYDDDRNAMTPPAERGMALFFSERIGCSGCHFGLAFSGTLRSERQRDVMPLYANTALYDLDGRGAYPGDAPGLAETSGRARDRGRFRVPTLRNVAVTAPYMHDGSIATLTDVIAHYARGGRRAPRGATGDTRRRDPRLKPFAIDADEAADLVAFLESLTDEAFLADPRFTAPP
jgi:cytochrome c peroxidase